MKKIFIISTLVTALILAFYRCGSDDKVESTLSGTWETEYEVDDGDTDIVETLVLKRTEKKINNSRSRSKKMSITVNVFSLKFKYYFDGSYAGNISITGRWKADKDKIEYKYDLSSVKSNYAAWAREDMEVIECNLLDELKENPTYSAKLLKYSSDKFVEKDEEDGEVTVYNRVAK